MDKLKQNIFWLVAGLLLILTIGFYLLKVMAMQGEADALERQQKDKHKMIGRVKEGPPYIREAKAYEKKIDKTTEAVKEVSSKRQFTLDPAKDFSPPPPSTPTRFLQWLVERYKERNAKLAKTGCRLPEEAEKYGDHPHEREVSSEEEDTVLRCLRISQEIFVVLGKAEVSITGVLVPDEDPENPGQIKEKKVTKKRKVDELVSFVFVDKQVESRLGRRASTALTPWERWPKPYKAHEFQLRFRSHASLVPSVLQALNEIGAFVIDTSRISIGRVNARDDAGPAGGGPDDTVQEHLKNGRYREAPVEVFVAGRVLEFDFKSPDEEFTEADLLKSGKRKRK